MKAFSFLRSRIPEYLVSDELISSYLESFSLDSETEVNEEVQSFVDLAYAECLKYILKIPASISQGGFSMSLSDKEPYRKELLLIYSKYCKLEEAEAFSNKPDITNAGEWE